MIEAQKNHDRLLCRRLEALAEADKDYWSFRGNSSREHGHGLFQYPAMMVPQVVRAVLEQACSVHPDIELVGDPFSGSGTIITESMIRGLSFWGTDINPLAILVCRVKCGPFYIDSLKKKIRKLFERIDSDNRVSIEINFHNQDKWFKPEVQVSLSKVRRAICQENSLWARRFFWVAIAETVRYTSNSRTSTFKLHIRSPEDIHNRDNDPLNVFRKILIRNLKNFEEKRRLLSISNRIVRGHYKGDVDISLGDVRNLKNYKPCDIIITSPPYGDNATTVPYGQYSYLPLQWINLEDIDPHIDHTYLLSTHEIDTRSLGGSKKVKNEDIDHIRDRSPSFSHYINNLRNQPYDRTSRVSAFFRDIEACLDPILMTLRSGGLMVWILGNRNVGGKRVPLDKILAELLVAHHTKLLCKVTRRIPSKRMAPKNNVAKTMSRETILVMRKMV